MVHNVKSNLKIPAAQTSPCQPRRQAEMGFDLALPLTPPATDTGTEELILKAAPADEPEVTVKKTAGKAARNTAANKAKPAKAKTQKLEITRPKVAANKVAAKLPARVAKTAKKIPSKRKLSKQGVASAEAVSALAIPKIRVVAITELSEVGGWQSRCPMEIEQLDVENNLGISAIGSKALDNTPPWILEPQIADDDVLKPLPRSASLQIYGSNNWIGALGHWLRRNWISALSRSRKPIELTVNRPAPKKLRPKEMVMELNRLAEENRTLRRKLTQIPKERAKTLT